MVAKEAAGKGKGEKREALYLENVLWYNFLPPAHRRVFPVSRPETRVMRATWSTTYGEPSPVE